MLRNRIKQTRYYYKKYCKLAFRNPALQSRISKIILTLERNPFEVSLSTHKVNLLDFGRVYSSRVTGDIRLIWNFDYEGDITIILLLDIGGHSGSKSVY